MQNEYQPEENRESFQPAIPSKS
jgi:hypothetical protein